MNAELPFRFFGRRKEKPTLRTYDMICFYFIGWASEDELMRHLEKLKRQDEAAAAKS